MEIGYIGLGKMGLGMAQLLTEKGHNVICYNRGEDGREVGRKAGLPVKDSVKELVDSLALPRFIWIMVSHQGVDAVLDELLPLLQKGDTVVDGGNSRYTETIRRAKQINELGIHFLDAGVSGGPFGARNGACIMAGGEKEIFEKYKQIFVDASIEDGIEFMGSHGAGHFVKMVHNGIEYGMMQAIGEGFEIMKKSDFNLNLEQVTDIYQHKSVIESRLVGWLKSAYQKYGQDLDGISGEVKHSGEGLWTVETADNMNIPVPVIKDALQFREDSTGNPSYTGQVVSALRNQFGGHDVSK